LRKKGVNIQPVRIAGRQIARTFWGQAWCEHIEKFSAYANRLIRHRNKATAGTLGALDSGLLTQTRKPFVGARRLIAGLSGPATLEPAGINVFSPSKKRAEQGDLGLS